MKKRLGTSLTSMGGGGRGGTGGGGGVITANKLQRLKSIFPFRGDAGVKGISAEIETNSKTERNTRITYCSEKETHSQTECDAIRFERNCFL